MLVWSKQTFGRSPLLGLFFPLSCSSKNTKIAMLRRESRRKGRNAKFGIAPGGDKEEAGWNQPHRSRRQGERNPASQPELPRGSIASRFQSAVSLIVSSRFTSPSLSVVTPPSGLSMKAHKEGDTVAAEHVARSHRLFPAPVSAFAKHEGRGRRGHRQICALFPRSIGGRLCVV